MQTTARGDALLAQIADTVTTMREEQAIFQAIMTQLVGAVEAHGEMLAEILKAAREETGPSEAANALAALAAAVRENTEALTGIEKLVDELPAEIGKAVVAAMDIALPAPEATEKPSAC